MGGRERLRIAAAIILGSFQLFPEDLQRIAAWAHMLSLELHRTSTILRIKPLE